MKALRRGGWWGEEIMSAIARRQFFDRKTFDPVSNERHAAILANLRAFGRKRLERTLHSRAIRNYPDYCKSTALRWAEKVDKMEGEGRVLVDLGCGESADCQIAENRGFTTHGFDLILPRDETSAAAFQTFTLADVAERIPLDDNSVDIALCSAMVDLIEPIARQRFYDEVARVLKPGGLFSCFIQWLVPGYGFDSGEEHQCAGNAGFVFLSRKASGFVARKGISNE